MFEPDPDCDHDWETTEVGCEDCGSHPGLRCRLCDGVSDLIYSDDPREER
jgi:hypothetical protein